MIVLRQLPRNSRIIIPVRQAAIRFPDDSLMAARTKTDWSKLADERRRQAGENLEGRP